MNSTTRMSLLVTDVVVSDIRLDAFLCAAEDTIPVLQRISRFDRRLEQVPHEIKVNMQLMLMCSFY